MGTQDTKEEIIQKKDIPVVSISNNKVIIARSEIYKIKDGVMDDYPFNTDPNYKRRTFKYTKTQKTHLLDILTVRLYENFSEGYKEEQPSKIKRANACLTILQLMDKPSNKVSDSISITLTPQLQAELSLILELRLYHLFEEILQQPYDIQWMRVEKMQDALELIDMVRIPNDEPCGARWVFGNYTDRLKELKEKLNPQTIPWVLDYFSKKVKELEGKAKKE